MNNPNGSRPARGIPNIGDGWLSPEDDPHALRGIPVFKPSMEEFLVRTTFKRSLVRIMIC